MDATPVLVVLQARMGSARLPGKVLRRLGRHTLLGHCVRRLQAAGVGPVVVATTGAPGDDAVVAEARRLDVPWFRGAETDVLARFARVADFWNAEVVVRATADNPAVDVAAPARVLQAMRRGADYVLEIGLPVGGAVEAIGRAALARAHREARAAYDREHVTPYVRERPGDFIVRRPPAPIALRHPGVRLTIDTPSDLAFMRRVLLAATEGDELAPLGRIVEHARALAPVLEDA